MASATPLVLRAFGPIELVTVAGHRVSGAGGQPKPLLILALAALTPGGISRDRLLRALWPGVGKERARASLKQHLYGLRQATGAMDLVSGATRIVVALGRVRVDALEFDEHVNAGRLAEAGKLLRGELLENVPTTGSSAAELERLVKEIRERWATRVALVRSRVSVEDAGLPLDDCPPPIGGRAVAIERELRAATRRFVQGLITLPADPVCVGHRTAWCSHDLLETIAAAEAAAMPVATIAECVADAKALWARVDGVRQLRERGVEEGPDSVTLEWLAQGSVRSGNEIGKALERHLLQSSFATSIRDRMHWQLTQALRALDAHAQSAPRILLLGGASTHFLCDLLPLMVRREAVLVVTDSAEDSLALVRDRLGALGKRLICLAGDAIVMHDQFEANGPYDLILTGQTIDGLTTRTAGWLIARLVEQLQPNGQLSFGSRSTTDRNAVWGRYFGSWTAVGRDRDDMQALVPDNPACRLECWPSPDGDEWWMTVAHRPLE